MGFQRIELPTAEHPACRHMLSKGMYVTGTLNPAADDGQVGDGNCWCGHTQHIVGPDNQLVERTTCQPGRACYEAIL